MTWEVKYFEEHKIRTNCKYCNEPFDITVKREYEENSSFQILKFECTKCNRENRIQK